MRPNEFRPTCLAKVSATRLITCEDDKKTTLWQNVDQPNLKDKFRRDHKTKVAYVSVHADTDRVFSAGFDGDVGVYKLSDPDLNPPPAPFTGHYPGGTPDNQKPQVWVVIPSPSGSHALSAENTGRILYWEVASRTVKKEFFDAPARVAALAFVSPLNGLTRFLAGDEHGKMVLWAFSESDLTAAPTKRDVPCGNPNSPVNTIAVTDDGNRAVSAGFDKIARIWNVQGAVPQLSDETDEQDDLIWRVAISPDGRKFATASQDQTVRLFDMSNGNEFPEQSPGVDRRKKETDGIMGVAFLSNTRIAYTAGKSAKAQHFEIWDIPANWPS
jgi:WD40 repeat protein